MTILSKESRRAALIDQHIGPQAVAALVEDISNALAQSDIEIAAAHADAYDVTTATTDLTAVASRLELAELIRERLRMILPRLQEKREDALSRESEARAKEQRLHLLL